MKDIKKRNSEQHYINRMPKTTKIKQYLDENYKINGSYTIYRNVVNVKGDIETIKPIETLTDGLFEFGTINGNFKCSSKNLKSFNGGPKIVKGDFLCFGCRNLESDEGYPEKIYGTSDFKGLKK